MLRILFLILFVPILANAEALVLEYKFSADTGDFVTDTSGNGLDGSILGGSAKHFGSGFAGRGLKLNGIDNHILVPDNPLFDLHQYTLMAWIKYKPNQWDREEVNRPGFLGGCK